MRHDVKCVKTVVSNAQGNISLYVKEQADQAGALFLMTVHLYVGMEPRIGKLFLALSLHKDVPS